MAKIISGSIDLKKINYQKVVKGKNGQEWYNILINVNDEKDQFNNDVSIIEGQTKEQREAKEKKNYLGNGKTIWTNETKTEAF